MTWQCGPKIDSNDHQQYTQANRHQKPCALTNLRRESPFCSASSIDNEYRTSRIAWRGGGGWGCQKGHVSNHNPFPSTALPLPPPLQCPSGGLQILTLSLVDRFIRLWDNGPQPGSFFQSGHSNQKGGGTGSSVMTSSQFSRGKFLDRRHRSFEVLGNVRGGGGWARSLFGHRKIRDLTLTHLRSVEHRGWREREGVGAEEGHAPNPNAFPPTAPPPPMNGWLTRPLAVN